MTIRSSLQAASHGLTWCSNADHWCQVGIKILLKPGYIEFYQHLTTSAVLRVPSCQPAEHSPDVTDIQNTVSHFDDWHTRAASPANQQKLHQKRLRFQASTSVNHLQHDHLRPTTEEDLIEEDRVSKSALGESAAPAVEPLLISGSFGGIPL